jgi:hypothetical protein
LEANLDGEVEKRESLVEWRHYCEMIDV